MKDSIVAAARRVFLREGYRASIDAIIQESGIARQTLYNHFKDKRALFAAVIEAASFDTMKELRTLELDANADLATALRSFGNAYMQGMLQPDNLAMTRLISESLAEFPEAGRIAYENGPERSIAVLRDYLEAQRRRGCIHCPSADLVAESFYGALVGPARFRYLLGVNIKTSPAQRRRYVDEIVALYVRGLGARSQDSHADTPRRNSPSSRTTAR